MGGALQIRYELKSLGDTQIASSYKKYLKSPYNFYGVRVPHLRKISKEYSKKISSIYDAYNLFDELWFSGNHEEMSLAIFLLQNFKKQFSMEMWDFLMVPKILEKLKTWDHVDALSTGIIGNILLNNPHLNSYAKRLACSENPWLRRMSIVSQLPAIKKGKIHLAVLLAEKLVYDEDIYVQKAAGWMMREVGKKNRAQLEEFAKIHRNMKLTAFNYSLEKMPKTFKVYIKNLKKEDKEKKENVG